METNKFVLPEKWCIKGCDELSDYFAEYGLNNRRQKQRIDVLDPIGGDCIDYYYFKIEHPYWDFDKKQVGELITFDQFKEHVLKEDTTIHIIDNKPKEIIGYKFKNKQLLDDFKLIYEGFEPWNELFDLLPDNLLKGKLERLGVIELWFEPVYKEETIKLKSGVELSQQDIEEVKKLIEIRDVCKSLSNESK